MLGLHIISSQIRLYENFLLAQKTRYIIVPSILVFGTGILFAINIPALSAFALPVLFHLADFPLSAPKLRDPLFVSVAPKKKVGLLTGKQ